MTLHYEERFSGSPYVERVTRGWTASDGSSIRPAEVCWHMVLLKLNGKPRLLIVGPWSTAGIAAWGEGAELLWIKFKVGVFMPHLPTRDFLNRETILPEGAFQSFWLKNSAWQFPNFDNVETFVDRLVRDGVLERDPAVAAALIGQDRDISPRTLRHRFLRATGLTRSHIRQVERAQQAAGLLKQGVPILDTVYEAGYFDQPHLTRSLKHWIGYTPAELVRLSRPDCHSVQDIIALEQYDTNVLETIE